MTASNIPGLFGSGNPSGFPRSTGDPLNVFVENLLGTDPELGQVALGYTYPTPARIVGLSWNWTPRARKAVMN